MEKKSLSIDRWPIILFVAFFIFLFFQYRLIYLYSDDYGYATLSYAVSTDKTGILGFFDYLLKHYMNWGGRVLYYSVLILGTAGGLWVIRIIEILIVFLDFWLIYRYLTNFRVSSELNKGYLFKAAFLTVLSYGLIQLNMATQSLYWYSAAITYTLPFLTFALLFYLLYADSLKELSIHRVVALCVLALVVGFSQEQYAITACFIYFVSYVIQFKSMSDRNKKYLLVIGLFLLLGSCILIFAPGNFKRSSALDADVPMMIVLVNRLRNILRLLFSRFMKYYILATIVALFFSSVKKVIRKRFIYLPFICFDLFIIAVYVKYGELADYISEFSRWRECLMYAALPVLLLHVFMLCKGKMWVFFSYLSGVICTLVMLISSELQIRTLLPFVLFGIPVIISLILEDEELRPVQYLCILALCIVCGVNLVGIYKGYSKNYTVNEINYQRLKMAAKDNQPKLVLYKNIDDAYSYVLPYMYDYMFAYQETNMKYYFGIDEETVFEWVDYQ